MRCYALMTTNDLRSNATTTPTEEIEAGAVVAVDVAERSGRIVATGSSATVSVWYLGHPEPFTKLQVLFVWSSVVLRSNQVARCFVDVVCFVAGTRGRRKREVL